LSPWIEITIRVGGAAAVFAAMARGSSSPRAAHLIAGRAAHWPGNFSILAIDIVTVRLLVPLTAVGVALIAANARATDTVQRMNGRPRHAGGAFCF